MSCTHPTPDRLTLVRIHNARLCHDLHIVYLAARVSDRAATLGSFLGAAGEEDDEPTRPGIEWDAGQTGNVQAGVVRPEDDPTDRRFAAEDVDALKRLGAPPPSRSIRSAQPLPPCEGGGVLNARPTNSAVRWRC